MCPVPRVSTVYTSQKKNYITESPTTYYYSVTKKLKTSHPSQKCDSSLMPSSKKNGPDGESLF